MRRDHGAELGQDPGSSLRISEVVSAKAFAVKEALMPTYLSLLFIC